MYVCLLLCALHITFLLTTSRRFSHCVALPQDRAAAAEEEGNTEETETEERDRRKKQHSGYTGSVRAEDGGTGSISIDELRLQIMKCTRVTAVGGNTSCLKSMCVLPTIVRALLPRCLPFMPCCLAVYCLLSTTRCL